jgi:hypothetical protein
LSVNFVRKYFVKSTPDSWFCVCYRHKFFTPLWCFLFAELFWYSWGNSETRHQLFIFSCKWILQSPFFPDPGLPDGIVSNQISIWVNFGESCNSRYIVGIFHVYYFTVIWYTYLQSFDIFCSQLVYFLVIWNIFWLFGAFFPFWYVASSRIWQPCPEW